MSSSHSQTTWFHSNRYCAKAACEHCGGVVRHEPWCISANPVVYYAHQIVLDSNKLTLADALVLHALGVAWGNTPCQGGCQTS